MKSARGVNLRQPYTLFNHSVPWSGAVRRWSWRKKVGKEISTGVSAVVAQVMVQEKEWWGKSGREGRETRVLGLSSLHVR